MAQIKRTEIKTIYLPSFEELPKEEQGFVEMEVPARMTDFEDVDSSLPQISQTASVMVKKIKSWNLEDDGKPVEITVENVVGLDAIDFASLTVALGLHKLMRLTAQKKTL